MKKMQRSYLKILLVFITLIITPFQALKAQTSSYRLKIADSLYQTKKFTQSFEHYREILNQKQYTPAMLLKMAYIQEGLGNIGEAMYYLNLYFLVTNDKSALEKMEELAKKFNLQGYETTDADRVLTFYRDYYAKITYATAALMILFLALVFYTRKRLHQTPVVSAIFLLIFMAAFFVHLNFGSRVKTGIIASTRTYVMDGPSPASTLIEVIGDGHRVEVIGKHDVWLKIKWNGNTAYIKEQSLLPIQL
jgi:hypothetical protein